MRRNFVIGLALVAIVSSARAADEKPLCDWKTLADQARHLDYGLAGLEHAEKLKELREKLADQEALRELAERWTGKGGILDYPNAFFFALAMRAAVEKAFPTKTGNGAGYLHDWLKAPSGDRGPELVRLTIEQLRPLLRREWLEIPTDEAAADKQAREVSDAMRTLQHWLQQYMDIPPEQSSTWFSLASFLDLVRAFHRGDLKSDAERAWREILSPKVSVEALIHYRTKQWQYYVNLDRYRTGHEDNGRFQLIFRNKVVYDNAPQPSEFTKADQSDASLVQLPLPEGWGKRKERAAIKQANHERESERRLRENLRSRRESFAETFRETLKESARTIQSLNEKIEALIGTPVESAKASEKPAHYQASTDIRQALAAHKPSEEAGDPVETLLRYKRELRERYADNPHSFFRSKASEKLKLETDRDFEKAFEIFDPAKVPQADGNGAFRHEELLTLRNVLESFGITSQQFLVYAQELSHLRGDSRAKDQLRLLLKDRSNEYHAMKVLEQLANRPHTVPPAYQEKSATSVAPLAPGQVAPYVRELTPTVVYHRAVTSLALETASRGEKSTAPVLFSKVNAAAVPLLGGTVNRKQALEALLVPLEQASAEARALMQDFTHMRNDLHHIHDNMQQLLQRKLKEAEAMVALKPDAQSLVTHSRKLADLEFEIDELRSQIDGAQHLEQTLEILHANTRKNRELLGSLTQFLQRTDPLRPNHIDEKTLRDTLKLMAPNFK